MEDKPIIFNQEMVKAILAGNKTQTRRIVKPQPEIITGDLLQPYKWYAANKGDFAGDPDREIKCPYQVGQKLWVRETAIYEYYGWLWIPEGVSPNADCSVTYIAGNTKLYYNLVGEDKEKFKPGKKPSIYMPCWASRITLEVTDIGCERVQDISEEDAKAEGVYFYGWDDPDQDDYKNYLYNDKGNCDDYGLLTAIDSFQSLWDSINAKRGYPWESNPYVWVIEFKIIK